MVMVMMASAAMPTATEAKGDDRCTAVIVRSLMIAIASIVRPIIGVAPMPLPVVVVAPMVPLSGAKVGSAGTLDLPSHGLPHLDIASNAAGDVVEIRTAIVEIR